MAKKKPAPRAKKAKAETNERTGTNVEDLIQDIRDLVEDVRAGDWVPAWRAAVDLQQKLLSLLDSLTGGGVASAVPTRDAEFDEAVGELETCCREPVRAVAAGAGDPVGVNPAAILAIVEGVLMILKWIRDRKKPQPA